MSKSLTPLDIKIIRHRLDELDCLLDVFEHLTDEQIEEAQQSLQRRLTTSSYEDINDVEKEVLKECIEGSTWFGCTDTGDEKEQQLAENQLTRTANRVAELLGLEHIHIPLY